MELLIGAFTDQFGAADNVVLFIKRHGSVSKEVGTQYLEAVLRRRPDPLQIILDCDRWLG